jgi:hypothetical protein
LPPVRLGYLVVISAPGKVLAAIAIGRIGIGTTALIAPQAARVVLPQAASTADSRAALRMLAARDVALGCATLMALRLGGVTPVVFATASSDLADGTVAFFRRSALSARNWVPPVLGGFAGAVASVLCARALTTPDSR